MMINDGQLFDSCPVECGTDSEDGAAQLQLVSTFKLCSYVDTDTFRRVVNFGAAPGLVFCIILQSFNDDHLVDVYVTQAFNQKMCKKNLNIGGLWAKKKENQQMLDSHSLF